jgi:hypothetical protein
MMITSNGSITCPTNFSLSFVVVTPERVFADGRQTKVRRTIQSKSFALQSRKAKKEKGAV